MWIVFVDHLRHDVVCRVPRPVPAHRRPSARRRLRAVPIHVYGTLRRTTTPRRASAGTPCWRWPGWSWNCSRISTCICSSRAGFAAACRWSPGGTPSPTTPTSPTTTLASDHAHHVSRRQQPVRMPRGDRHAGHRCTTRRLENRLHLGGRPRVPQHLHDLHSDYPQAPERLHVLSPYSRHLHDQLGIGRSTSKLVPNLQNKTGYGIHHHNLQQCVDLGIKLTGLHRVLAFSQSAWLEP